MFSCVLVLSFVNKITQKVSINVCDFLGGVSLKIMYNPGQVVHTHVPLSPSSINCHHRKLGAKHAFHATE